MTSSIFLWKNRIRPMMMEDFTTFSALSHRCISSDSCSKKYANKTLVNQNNNRSIRFRYLKILNFTFLIWLTSSHWRNIAKNIQLKKALIHSWWNFTYVIKSNFWLPCSLLMMMNKFFAFAIPSLIYVIV